MGRMHTEATGRTIEQRGTDMVGIVLRAIQQAVRQVRMSPERKRPLSSARIGAACQSAVGADSGQPASAKVDQLQGVVIAQQAARALLEFHALDERNSRI